MYIHVLVDSHNKLETTVGNLCKCMIMCVTVNVSIHVQLIRSSIFKYIITESMLLLPDVHMYLLYLYIFIGGCNNDLYLEYF